MELSLRLKRLFSLSSYPAWLAWLPSEYPSLGTAFLAWRKRLLFALVVPFVLLAVFVILAQYAPSPKPAQVAFAIAILTMWPFCLLPVTALSCHLAFLAIRVLRAAPSPSSGGPRSPFAQWRLRSFVALLLVLAVVGAISIVPWLLVVYQLAPTWLA